MLTQDLLNEIFKYDPETGVLERTGNTYGRKASDNVPGYRQVNICGRPHKVHRIVWLMLYGHIPKGMRIDHINGDASDNRRVNLRLATHAENIRNSKVSARNTTGYKGVSIHGSGYASSFCVDGVKKHIGTFPTAEEAAAAYDTSVIAHHGVFARTNAVLGLLPNTSASA